LNELREKILNSRENSALFDTKLFVSNFEKGIEKIWSMFQRSERTEGIYSDDRLTPVQQAIESNKRTQRLIEEEDARRFREIKKEKDQAVKDKESTKTEL